MPKREVALGDLMVSTKHGTPERSFFGIQARRDGETVWEVPLEVTDGDGELMPRIRGFEVVGDHVMVRTDGEHYKGASSHMPRLHVIDARGRLLWRMPWRVTGSGKAARRGLLVLCKSSEYHFPVGEPVAVARLVRWEDGEVIKEWSFDLSGREGELLARTSWPWVRGEIVPHGKRWQARVEVRWRDGSNTLTRDLAGS